MSINQKIFSLIEKKNLKQADLARILNVRTSVIASWKTRGNNPPAEYLVQICGFLGISISELFDYPEEKFSENETEVLKYFRQLPDREQIKWIGKLELAVQELKDQQKSQSKIS